MYVFINSSDKTGNVENNSITIENALQERIDSADFSLSGFKPNDLDDVKIYEGFPVVNSSINSVSLKKYYWETIQNNIFRIGDIVDVNAPNRIEGTVSEISEDEDTVLGYTFLEVDTTATGSTVALSADGVSYTTVTDGGSITIPSTYGPEIYVRTNITANRIYLSSNDYNASSSKDSSQRQSVIYNAPDSGNTSVASQGGLLINIDSATGDIPASSGYIENEVFGVNIQAAAAGTRTGYFTSSVQRTGDKTLYFKSNVETSYGCIVNFNGTVGSSPASGPQRYLVPCKPSTKYKLGVWVDVVENTASLSFRTKQGNSSLVDVGSSLIGTPVVGTGWQYISGIITTGAITVYLKPLFETGSSGVGTNVEWYTDINSMTLEEVVEPVANSLTSSSPSLVSFTAVGSTDNIDQSFTTAPNYLATVGEGGGLQYREAQSFTPTKSKLTGVYLYKSTTGGTPTGNVVVDIRTDSAGSPSTTVLATYTITLATFNALTTNAEFLVNLPCNLTIGSSYWITISNTATEGAGNAYKIGALNAGGYTGGVSKYSTDGGTTWTLNGTVDLYFKTLYYKPTTNFKASQNNQTVSISADEDGFNNGTIVNLSTGTYTAYNNLGTLYTGAYDVFQYLLSAGLTNQNTNNLRFDFANEYITYKFKAPTGLTFGDISYGTKTVSGGSGARPQYIDYSYDNVTWVNLSTVNTASTTVETTFSIPGGSNTVYVRYLNGTFNNANYVYYYNFIASLDTSSLSTLRNYPTNVNRFREYGTQLGSQTTTATYRVSKYGFPAIEWLPSSSTRKNGNTKLTFSENFTSIPTIGNIAGRKKFAGNIIEIQDSNNTLLSNVQFNVKALDYTRVFDKKLLNDSYEDKDARYIINDFCNTTINLNQELDDFEYANNTALQASWIESGTGGNPTLDTSNYREGTQSAILPWTGSGTGTFTGTISAVNVSMFTGVSSGTPTKGRLGFWYKLADYTKVTSVTVRVGSDSSNYISSTFTPTSNDFTFYDFLLSGGTKVGTPVWTAIDYIAFVIVETATSSINIDGIRILENDFFRHYPYVQESVILSDFRINRVKPTEIMQRLADSLAWYWYVDYDKYIHLFSETTKIAPIEITQTSNNFSNLTISADTSRLVNRQVIRADDETSTSTYSQVIQGDGIIREWLMKTSFKGLTVKLNDGTSTDTMEATTTTTTVKATAHGLITGDYIVNRTRSNAVREITYVDANTFTVSAVTGQTSGDSFSLFVSQTVGIEGLDVETSYDYVSNYTEKSIRASSSEPTLIAGQFLLFSYNEVIPILVQRTDNVSIALMKSTLGYTDGIFDGQPITDKTIKTRSEASKMAESIINKYSNVIITAQFSTNQEGLESGQIITIQDSGVTERNINQSFVIQSVRSRQLAWGENRYTVTCSSLLFGMLELLQQILASRRKVNVDENEAINNIENANETLTISDSTLVNDNQEIETETITISDVAVENIVTPPFKWAVSGTADELKWELGVWG